MNKLVDPLKCKNVIDPEWFQ